MTNDHLDRDLYEVLGVGPGASPAEVTSAYRRRVRDLHPDSRAGASGDGSGLAEVLAAYQVLRDAGQRAAYDAWRRTGGARPPSPGGIRIPVRRIESTSPPATNTWLRAGPVRLDLEPPAHGDDRSAGSESPSHLPPELLRVIDALFFGRWWR